MKQIYCFLAFVFSATMIAQTTVYDINTWDLSSGYAEVTVVNGITIIPGASTNTGAVDTGNHTFTDGYPGSKRLKTNGSSYNNTTDWANPNRRYFTLPVAGSATIKVWYRNGGGGQRVLYISEGNTVLGSNSITDNTDGQIFEATYSGGVATDIKISAGLNAINIYKIEVTLEEQSNGDVAAIDPVSCGEEYTFLAYEFINAVPVDGATQYEFKLESGLYSETASSTNPAIRIYDFPGYEYDTNYNVSVRYLKNDIWSDFSPTCQISTVEQPITEVQILPCGSTLPSINTNIYFKAVVGTSMYRYEVTNLSTNAVQVYESSARFFRLTMLNDFQYNTAYSVRAQVLFNNVLMPFGPACTLSTPAVSTQLRSVSCGQVLPNINSLIYAQAVTGATEYEFEVTNTDTNTVQALVSTLPNVSLAQLTPAPNFGILLSVRVRAKVDNVFGAFGVACNVSIAQPSTKLRPSSCGVFLADNNTPIYANNVVGATEYQFEVTNTTNSVVEVITRQVRIFSLGMMSVPVTSGTTYAVRVRALTNGFYTLYGDVCNVTTPETSNKLSRMVSGVDTTNFDVKAYPNPFSNHVEIAITNPAESNLVQIFDMTGKLVFSKKMNEDKILLGQDFNSGVYLVQVTSGNEVRNIKVVKQ